MEVEQLLANFGYAALFFVFCLGIVGLPVPNEVVVMTSGAVSSDGLLIPIPAFLMAYAGICCGLTVGFLIGRLVGAPVLERLTARPKLAAYVQRSKQLVSRYGSFALLFTYFIPVVRNVMPYVVGANSMRYTTFALFAYSGAFVWTCLFFVIGYITGTHVELEEWEQVF